MTIYIILDENNRVLHVGSTPIGENHIEVETDDERVLRYPQAFEYVDGTLVFYEDKYNELIAEVM